MKLADREVPIENKAESTEVKSPVDAPVFKVKFAMKAIAFSCAVVSLSWFFEGWREIHRAVNFATVGILVVGVVGTSDASRFTDFLDLLRRKTKRYAGAQNRAVRNALRKRHEAASRKDTRGIEVA